MIEKGFASRAPKRGLERVLVRAHIVRRSQYEISRSIVGVLERAPRI